MDRRKRMSIVFGVVGGVGAILIAIAAFLTAKEQWFVTYKNEAAGFKMKHPVVWAFKENVDGANVIFYSPVENALDFFKENVNIVRQDISANPQSLYKYSENAVHQLQVVFKKNINIIESTDTYWAGHSAHKIIFIGKGDTVDLKYMSVWTISGTTAYQFTYTATVDSFDRHLKKVNKMLDFFGLL